MANFIKQQGLADAAETEERDVSPLTARERLEQSIELGQLVHSIDEKGLKRD